jgi:hypothetical protein
MGFRQILLISALVVGLCAPDAFAWGPATHTRLAADLLSQLSLLPSVMAAVLARYASSFIFGNIAADVVFAKKLSRVRQFCHHWTTGFKLLDDASGDEDRAFALGYLSHLAADTVAHGKFVPRQLCLTRTTFNFGHLYWEMRADAFVEDIYWERLENTLAVDHDRHHHVLARELTDTLLPYYFNRRVFDRVNRLVVRRYWQRCMGTWARRSRWSLCDELVADYWSESLARIRSVLIDGTSSPVLREDPSGNAGLQQARDHRKTARRLRRRGLPTERRAWEASAGLAPPQTMINHEFSG